MLILILLSNIRQKDINLLLIEMREKIPEISYLNTDNVEDMLKEYAQCEFSIGVRMHSNILSLAAGTPFISVAYDEKNLEFLKLYNNKFSVLVTDDYYDKLQSLVVDLMDNLDKERQTLLLKKETYNVYYNRFIEKICNILQTSI